MARFRVLVALLVGSSCGRSVPFDDAAPSAPGAYVTVGAQGAIFRSVDLTGWTAEMSGTAKSLASVAFGRSTFVAVGGAGTIVTSSQKGAWVARPSGTTTDLSHVIFTGEKFLAVGGDWSSGASMVESPDGSKWTVVKSPANYLFRAVAHRAGTVVASANYLSDLQTPALFTTTLSPGSAAGGWTQRKGPNFNDSVTVGDRILAVGHGVVAGSADGVTWAEQKAGPDRAIAWSGDLLVIVGENGGISTSTEGTRWTAPQLLQEKGGWLAGVTWGTPGFVAVGSSGSVITSADGSRWTKQASVGALTLNDVAWAP